MKIMPWLPAHSKTIGKVIVVDRIFYQQSHFYLFPLWMPIGTYRPTPSEIKKWVLSIHYLQYAFRLQQYITTLNLTFARGLVGRAVSSSKSSLEVQMNWLSTQVQSSPPSPSWTRGKKGTLNLSWKSVQLNFFWTFWTLYSSAGGLYLTETVV